MVKKYKISSGDVFNNIIIIEEIFRHKRKREFKCMCSCGKELILTTDKLKTQISCGCKNIAHTHKGLAVKHKHIYKKWHSYKKDNRLTQEFLDFNNFLNYILKNLGDRKNKYGYMVLIDESRLASPRNIKWAYTQYTENFCGVEYKWCSSCERFVQNSDKFWPKKKNSSCRSCLKAYLLKSKYNLEYKDYLVLLNKCDRQCQICSHKDKLVVDHCHSSGKIRGILCSNCNSGLGQFSDNTEYIQAAINYLSCDLTTFEYDVKKSKFTKINKICPITNNNSNVIVDHCHKTNLVRGCIDFNINIGIGLFKDDPSLLQNAIFYLKSE